MQNLFIFERSLCYSPFFKYFNRSFESFCLHVIKIKYIIKKCLNSVQTNQYSSELIQNEKIIEDQEELRIFVNAKKLMISTQLVSSYLNANTLL